MWLDKQAYRRLYRKFIVHVILKSERVSYNQTMYNNIAIKYW